MLKKLLKKDFQATARTFLPMILGFVIVSVLAKILFEIGIMSQLLNESYVSDTNEFMVISSFIFLVLYFIYIVAFFIMTYVFIVHDFYKTMVGEQAYLTHTLPVKTSTLIGSKLTIAVFWQTVVYLLVFLSFLLFAVGHMPQIPWQELMIDFDETLGLPTGQYITVLVVCMVIGAFSSPLMFYASVAIGHLFGKHKIMGAILSYLGIYTVMQIISTIAMIAFGYSFTTLLRTPDSTVNVSFYSSFFSSYMWYAIIFSTTTSIIFYFITNYVMSKKLNLE